MVENIKDIIAKNSIKLFHTYGYDAVSMRQVARECGISVGNLTYHYGRKEDLLMIEHDYILKLFLEEVLGSNMHLRGIAGYITVETAFLHKLISVPEIRRMYLQVINIPSLRERYYKAHYDMLQMFLDIESFKINDASSLDFNAYSRNMTDDPKIDENWEATVALSALEFQMAETGILEGDFQDTMIKIFKSWMIFRESVSSTSDCWMDSNLDCTPSSRKSHNDEFLEKAVFRGIELSRSMQLPF